MRALPGPFSSPHRRAPRTKSKGVLAMSHTLTATHVGVTRLAGHIGAEITGVDTGTPLSDEVIAKIRQTLLDHKVVFLRGQSLNYRRQVQLRMAHQMLAAMGAEAFAERARR